MYLLYDTKDILIDKDIKYSSGNIRLFELLNPKFCKTSIYLPLFESIEIVRNYLKENVEVYLDSFDQFINDGTIELLDSIEYPKTKDMALYNNMASHFEIDVAITHSYADPGKIIHEFIHPKNSKEGPNLETRSTLTELVSIFFETDLYRWMENEGYDLSEINAARRFRIDNCFAVCEQVGLDLILIDAFKKQGIINENTYQERKDLEIFPTWKNKKTFDKHISHVCKAMKSKEFDPKTSVNYILGTLIAFHYINTKNDKTIGKFIELNRKLKEEISFHEALQIIDVNLDNEETFDSIFISFEEEVNRINKSQQEVNKLL